MAQKLDIAFHAPAHSTTFTAGLKPFAEAAMHDVPSLEIALHPEGTRGGLLTTQVQLLESGSVDAAFVIPGFTPERFPDNFVFGIPGLFRDITEATLTYSRVVNAGVLRGYGEFHVIGAFSGASAPSRPPPRSTQQMPRSSRSSLPGWRRIRAIPPILDAVKSEVAKLRADA